VVPRARLDRGRFVVPTLVLLTLAARVLTLRAPLSADEGGFLLVASQWHPGTSLYGDYWVDRPPLLLALFDLAHLLGGEVALRVLGCLAAAASVVAAGALGRRVAGPRGGGWVAVATAGLVSTPLNDAWQVSGELLAVPFVLAGLVWWLQARDGAPHPTWRAAAAGTAGAAALLVKQSFADVFVVVVVLSVLDALAARRSGPTTPRTPPLVLGRHALLPAFAAGSVVTTAGVLLLAVTRGTSVAGLWEAVVVFRSQASRVIAASAGSATSARFDRLPLALVASGAVLVVLGLVVRSMLLRVDRLAQACVALLAWETFAVVAGGSYWLHYLLGLVPGLALALALTLAPGERRRPWLRHAVARHAQARHALARPRTDLVPHVGRVVAAFAAGSAVVALGIQGTHPASTSTTLAAGEWLKHHHRAGDTAVLAYGQPNLLVAAGVTSPYPELWSLPVRVRDPRLRDLVSVLRGPQAPDWVLVRGRWATWGVDAVGAERVVARRYREVTEVCGWVVYLRDGEQRPHAVRQSCEVMAARA
jgi:hypothetical protein